jgi:hypothetical protein
MEYPPTTEYVVIIPKILVILTESNVISYTGGFDVVLMTTATSETYRIIADWTDGDFFSSLKDVGRPRLIYGEEKSSPVPSLNVLSIYPMPIWWP